MGLCSANEPMDYRERVFTYGSILARVETEKEEGRKTKMKGGIR